ncbi:MAG: riboflavin synthase [Verrucomicrobia bacterium]|nr:riboflavin synthase [Verrucomicrobiota bacterium]MDA1085558.1 riboflavin synthase [Verrucomicrobiota bacterium]
MFTGIIETRGDVREVAVRGEGSRLKIGYPAWDSPVAEGESIAVNGVCLTAAQVGADAAVFDVLKETLDRTNLGGLAVGAGVNLERSLRVGDRMGGHFVTGHVDGIARVQGMRPVGDDIIVRLACSEELMRGVVMKGSVACDGISLTVAEIGKDGFAVHIIPFTREETTWGALCEGDAVNIEIDMLGRYVQKYTGTLNS